MIMDKFEILYKADSQRNGGGVFSAFSELLSQN